MGRLLRHNDELCALTDSLPGTVRWRLRDYEEILKAELALLVAMETNRRPRRGSRGGAPRPHR
jgi:hypothetical protein